jgi:DNA repair protein RadD
MRLRGYQQRALDELWHWFRHNPEGHPIVGACVSAGKSLMIAALAQRADAECPGTRILVLVHQKELLEQNLDKLQRVWPTADVGVISASMRRKQVGHQITYATIGSVYKIARKLGRIDIVLADECHLISPKEAGMWRQFLADLSVTNPCHRVVGWTGTPFRGNGLWLTSHDESLFTAIATTVGMRELIDAGYLAPLVPVATQARIDTAEVRKAGDDYVVSELARVTDTQELVRAAAAEIVNLAQARRRWLVFCVTIDHATHVRDALRALGVACEMVSAETPKAERERVIGDFRSGRIRAIANVAVLTTGFDVPEIDFIALLRATQSPVLYVQMAGRGMRCIGSDIHESRIRGKSDCLWADFTDTTGRMGPVDEIKGRAPKPSSGPSTAPYKVCDECGTRNATAAAKCIQCGHEFPPPKRVRHGAEALGAEILSGTTITTPVEVTDVFYRAWQKPGSPDSLLVEYFAGLHRIASEWICLQHNGYARTKAESWWRQRATTPPPDTVAEAIERTEELRKPVALTLDLRGKYPQITTYTWTKESP